MLVDAGPCILIDVDMKFDIAALVSVFNAKLRAAFGDLTELHRSPPPTRCMMLYLLLFAALLRSKQYLQIAHLHSSEHLHFSCRRAQFMRANHELLNECIERFHVVQPTHV